MDLPVLASGSRSTVYAVGPGLVAKVPLPGTPDAWIRDEAAYTSSISVPGVRVPRVVEVVEIDGRPAAIYEWIDARSMWDCILDSPAQAADHGRRLADLHHRILTAPVPVTVPRRADRLAAKIRLAAARLGTRLCAALDQIGNGGPVSLCHGDLHPGNVLIDASGPAVIDWFDAGRGAAVGDIARSALLLGGRGLTAGAVDHLPGATRPLLDDVHDAYLERITGLIGLTDAELRAWQRVEAVARLSEGVDPVGLLAVWDRDEPRPAW